jgi:hypothetical protein
MNDHKKFEILCALISVGQASDADLRELAGHAEGCVGCQRRLAEFAQVGAQAMPLSAEKYSRPRSPRAMTVRFVETARAQGIPLHEPTRLLPDRMLFGLSGWNGHLAAALLLVSIVAVGVSRSAHSRSPSSDTAATAKQELSGVLSESGRTVANLSTQLHTKRVRAPRRMKMPRAVSVESVLTLRQLGAEQTSRSLNTANRYQSLASFNGQPVPTEAANNEYLRLSQSSDSGYMQPWFDTPPLMPSAGVEAEGDCGRTDPRERRAPLALMSLNFPPRVFTFRSDRGIQSDSGRSRSVLVPNIDWHQVWLVRADPLRNSNDPTRFRRPGVFAPESPFLEESSGKQP